MRYMPIIEWLQDKYDIHVAIIDSADAQMESTIAALQQCCKMVNVFRRKQTSAPLLTKASRRALSLIAPPTPYILQCHDEKEIKSFFSQQVAAVNNFDAVIWVTPTYLDIGLQVFKSSRVVLDFIDSIYLNQTRKPNQSVLDEIDLWHLKRWEKDVIRRVHKTIFISTADANAASDRTNEVHVDIIPNGVYLADLPAIESKKPSVGSQIVLGFVGHMGYDPNIRAVARLAKIFEQLLKLDTRYRLLIIGRSPAADVLALQSETITVTGEVDNIWTFINKVDYFVFPMTSGSGQQNKVLEAMYAEKVVICNATANSGVSAVGGQHMELCETDEDFVSTIHSLTNNPNKAENLAAAGRRFVMENYSWESILPKYEAILESTFLTADDSILAAAIPESRPLLGRK